MFVYLIEASIAFSIIYSFYKYVFFQTTHFEWNRAYFYFAVFISLILPWVPFPFWVDFFAKAYNPEYLLNPLTGDNLIIYKQTTGVFTQFIQWITGGAYMNLKNIAYIIYFSGVLRFAYLFIKNHWAIYRLIKKSERKNKGKWIHVKIIEDETAFSWFKYIFTGISFEKLDEQEQKKVLEHEKIHVFEHHSFDILIYEIYELIFWFNPLIRKAKKTLKDLHEYIVDTKVTGEESKYHYADLLIKLSVNKNKKKLANLFSRSPLKDRIRLLAFPEGEHLKKFRFVSGIPVIIFILIIYSFIISRYNISTNSLQVLREESFAPPVDYNTELISGFFENKELKSTKEYKIIAAHRELSYATESYQKIKSCKKGKVIEVSEKDDWGLKTIQITIKHNKIFSSKYKGLWKSKVKKGDTVYKNQVIGLMGDKRLYELFSFQLLCNGKPVDPSLYIRKL
ncbi:MAG: peptidoglycan DD-metalloendopeptidase family protein [Bacteroidales bacterium]|nr:peptidoglycan DD-metalloendopeptidase family protein [Bacteroidales bacterium]